MQRVYSLTEAAYRTAAEVQQAGLDAQALRERIARIKTDVKAGAPAGIDAFDTRVEALATGASGDTLSGAGSALASVMNTMQGADAPPTAMQVTAINTALRNARRVLARWRALTKPGSDLYFPTLQK
jgi:hypothetical protein